MKQLLAVAALLLSYSVALAQEAGGVPYIVNGWWELPLTLSGSGTALCLTTGCQMTAPNLGTPSAINLANATNFPVSGVTPGSYLSANITVNAQGAVTAAANGGIVYNYQVVCSNAVATPVTATGNTNENNLANCTIPAAAASAVGALVKITVSWYRSAAGTDSTSFLVRMCAVSACTNGGLLIIDPTDAGSGSVQYFTQGIVYITGSAAEIVPTIGLASGTSSTFAPAVGTQNMANSQYLAFNCTNVTSSADTCGIYAYTVEVYL